MKRLIALILVIMIFLTGCADSFGDVDDKDLPDQSMGGGDEDSLPSDSDSDNLGNGQSNQNQPENNNPENSQPDSSELDNSQPNNSEPDNSQPDSSEPDNSQPDNSQPDNSQPDNSEPDNSQPDNSEPDNSQPDNSEPDNSQPDISEPENPEIVHSYNAIITAPTCETEGYTTYTCTTCNDSYVADKVFSLGHSYNATEIAPTCEGEGYTVYLCSVCNDTYTADVIVALGHSWIAATTESPETCSTCGVTEGEKLPSTTPDSGNSSDAYSETLFVNYINVGQGDSILIKVGDCDILIDAGTANYGTTVSNYLQSKGVDDIELLINTHPDSDHCGGLTTVLNNYVVEQVWISKFTDKSTSAYTNFISAVSKEGLSAKKPNVGTVFTYEHLTLTVLYSSVGSDSNNSSIVIMLEYGSFRFLFTGDVGEEVETQLVSSGADLDCDVLKVGHHGSKYSSTSAFLNAVSAEYGVICVGSNSYGHPTSEALSRLSSAGVTVYRTDLNGNVVFSTDGATLYLPGGGTDSSGSGSSSGGSSSGGSSSDSSSSGGSSSGSSSSTDIFIGNTETKVFHLPTCSNLPVASKQNTMYNYWWIINIAGYSPCGRCLKDYSSGGTTYIANSETNVYHLSSCSYLPSSSKRIYIQNTAGYTPCGHCIKNSATTSYIANIESKVYHLSTCSYLPAASKQTIIYSTSGYTACGHCIK